MTRPLTLWQRLVLPATAKLAHERARGAYNAHQFLAGNPSEEEKASHYRMSLGIIGDSDMGAAYDRGYHDVLSQHMNDPDGMPTEDFGLPGREEDEVLAATRKGFACRAERCTLPVGCRTMGSCQATTSHTP